MNGERLTKSVKKVLKDGEEISLVVPNAELAKTKTQFINSRFNFF